MTMRAMNMQSAVHTKNLLVELFVDERKRGS